MPDVLAELWQAEATIVRMRDAASLGKWIDDGGEVWTDRPDSSPVALGVSTPDAKAIVLAWPVLIEAVLPIIQETIARIVRHATPEEAGSEHVAEALRLARFVNERAA